MPSKEHKKSKIDLPTNSIGNSIFEVELMTVYSMDTTGAHSFSAANGKPLKLVIVSDIHLGYKNADKDSFNRFLDSLQSDKEITDLILLGDIVDMWRRDASGVFLENWDIVQKIISLKQKMRVHYVAGNHDYHVLYMRGHSYPFSFTKSLKATDGDQTYTIVHGLEFDPHQKAVLMEALCHAMYDPIEALENLFGVTQPPEKRLSQILGDIEHTACSSVKNGEILVFGHTHHPFINKAENVVNTGCWVADSTVHNTFVELSGGKPRLFVFEGKEIRERINC
jgi:UDP-2,3-diacylglucosamine pyrophosphatase LpxH